MSLNASQLAAQLCKRYAAGTLNEMRNVFLIAALLLEVVTVSSLLGCSSAEKEERERSRVWIDKLALINLHYRRPQAASADSDAGPGGEDYQSHPLPNSRLDCMPADQLFQGLKLDAIRSCLSSSNLSAQDFILTFSVQKSIQPVLVLKKEEVKKGQPRRPVCVDQLLSEIPVPREIYFQGVREGHGRELGCYAAGIVPETAPLVGFRLMPQKTDLALRIPPVRPLKSIQDVRLLLLAWVLKPFWDAQRNLIEARVVPDQLCRVCIGEKNLVQFKVPPVPLWPTDADYDTTQSVKGSGTDVPMGTPNLPEQTGIN